MNDHALRQVGLRVTEPRLKILQLLEFAKPHHLSAEDVYQQLKEQGDNVGLATVYRVLTQFESVGLAHRHYFDGGYSVFEIAHGKHHDHLVCIKCGMVKEFLDVTIEKQQAKLVQEAGFTVVNHQHTIYGVCKNCNK